MITGPLAHSLISIIWQESEDESLVSKSLSAQENALCSSQEQETACVIHVKGLVEAFT